ncbi:MAG: ribonuclease III [Alistipes sp.]|nr:ribonuclease III [Alistipes sp.]
MRLLRRRFGVNREYYKMVDDMFGFIPNNIELYKLALIHKSASLILEDGRQINNERLEYLGDAIIEAVTSDYIFIEYPDEQEGFMTRMRAKMVSRQSLNEIARRIGLADRVVSNSGGNIQQKHIYGDAFEAMIGAIYLDKGYDFVNRLLINDIYGNCIDLDELAEDETDFKSRLIEWSQKHRHGIEFRTTACRAGHPSRSKFRAVVLIDGMEVGYGEGESKKEAEQQAARSVSAAEPTDKACAEFLDTYDRLSGDETAAR